MTDYLNNSNKTTLLFKKFQNKSQAAIDVTTNGSGGTSFFNEQKKSLNNIYNTDIFIENIERNLSDEYKLSSLDACGNIPGSIWNTTISDQNYSNSSFLIPNTNLIFYKEIYLNPVSGTNNAWWIIPPEFSDQITDNNLLKDMIPFNFNSISLSAFSPIVKYWNGTQWRTQSQNNVSGLNWLIDYASGILQFYQNDSILNSLNIDCNSSDQKKRPRISFIKYVGEKGLENLSGRGGGGSIIDGNITSLDISGNISANNLFMNLRQDIEYNGIIEIGTIWHGNYNELLGYSISLNNDGTIIVVSAPYAFGSVPGSNFAGRVRVYRYNGTSWNIYGNYIEGTIENEYLGLSVKINSEGNKFILGGLNKARVYQYNGSSWVQQGSDITGGSNSHHIVSIDSEGNIIAVGEPKFAANTGIVRIFDYDGSEWNEIGSITGNNIGEYFGGIVELSDDGKKLAITSGLFKDPTSYKNIGSYNGKVTVYNYNGSSWNTYGDNINGNSGDLLGLSLALNSNGNTLVIGSPGNSNNSDSYNGKVIIYNYDNENDVWVNIKEITGQVSPQSLGSALSLSSDGKLLAISSAPDYIYDGYNTTSNYYSPCKVEIYHYSNNSWNQIYSAIVENNVEDILGGSVSLSKNGKILGIGVLGLYNVNTYNIYDYVYNEGEINFIANNENISKIISTYDGNDSSINFSVLNNNLLDNRVIINKYGVDITGNISTNVITSNIISTNVITSNNNIINENLWKQIILQDGFIYNLNSSYTPPYIENLVPYGSSITFSNSNRNIEFSSTTSTNEYVALSIDYYFYIPQQFFIQFTVYFNNGLFFNFYENAGTTTTALNYQGNTLTYIDRSGTTISYNLIIQMTETIIIWYDTSLLNIYKLTASNLEKIASIDNFYSGESFFYGSPKNMNFKIGGSGPSTNIPMGTSIRNLYINNYSPYFKFIEEFEYNLSNNQLLITNDINIKSNLFVENKIKFFNDQNTINITTHRKNIISESLTRNSIEIGHQYYRNHSRFSTTYQKKDFINIGFFSNAYLSNSHTAQSYNPNTYYPEKTIIIGNYNCEFFKGGMGSTTSNNVILGFNCFSGPNNTMINTNYNVVIGSKCGYNMRNASSLVLIGNDTGYNTESFSADIFQTTSSIAIGNRAGYNRLHSNCIILNGNYSPLDSNQENSFYVHPIRAAIGSAGVLQYDSSTKEVTYANTLTTDTLTTDTLTTDDFTCNKVHNHLHPPYNAGNGRHLYVGRGSGLRWMGMSCYSMYYGTGGLGSDDRIKHNEVDVENPLNIIRLLNPQKYKKTINMYQENYNGDISGIWDWEVGLIAQDILKINDLSFCVKGGDKISEETGELIEEQYYLDYNSIFTYNVGATKELDNIVQNQQIEINEQKEKNLELENKVDILKNKLNELLSESGKETINF